MTIETMIVVLVCVVCLHIFLCVIVICDALKDMVSTKYRWMYESHQERDERFDHEEKINAKA